MRYRHEYLKLGAIVVLASGLTWLYLGQKSLWLDEVYSIATARSWDGMWQTLRQYDANMWLYYLLLHFWLRLGESEFVVRSLSALFAVATLPLVYALGKQLFHARVGLIAAALLPINPFFMSYAQEARGYSLLILLSTLSSYCFVRAIRCPARRFWIGYVASSVLALYTHFFAGLVLLAHAASLCWLERRRLPWRSLLISGVAGALLLLPLLLFQPLSSNQIAWLAPPTTDDLYRFVRDLVGGNFTLLWLCVLLAALTLGLAGGRARPWDGEGVQRWQHSVVLLWFFLPIVLSLAISWVLRPVFLPRYLSICCVPFVLLIALSITGLRRRQLVAAALLLVVVFSGQSLHRWYTHDSAEDWRAVTRYILAESQSDDAVGFYAYFARGPFEYYRAQLGMAEQGPQLLELASAAYPPGGGGRLPEPNQQMIAELPQRYARIWLVLNRHHTEQLGRPAQREQIKQWLEAGYALVEERAFADITVIRYARKPTPNLPAAHAGHQPDPAPGVRR